MSIDHHGLAQFIARCNPSAPAAGESEYVERIPPVAPRLTAEIMPSPNSRVLLLGQTGVGKSTELLRLAREIEVHLCPLVPPIELGLDLRSLTWHEILVFSAAWALEKFGLQNHHAAINFDLAMRAASADRQVLTPTLTQRFRNDPRTIRHIIEAGRAQFWDLAEAALRAVKQFTGLEIVLILDGLEKMSDEAAKELFYDEARFLDQLPCRAVITAPLSLSFQPFYGSIEEHFPYPAERLRAISCLRDEPGFSFFQHLAATRGASEFMAPKMIDKAVSWGGGLPRQFLQLLGSAASQALTDGTNVEEETFVRAIQRLSDKWQYQLEPDDYTELEKDDSERSTMVRSRLLRLGALIEYDKPDGSLRLGLNPLVGTLIKRRQAALSPVRS